MCYFFFFFNYTATTEIYTLSLPDALPISTHFNTFSIPVPVPWYVNAYAQVTPVGEITANLDGATQNTLPH